MTDPVEDPFFSKFLVTRYPTVKARFPSEGRRKWRLRVIKEFWDLAAEAKNEIYNQSLTQAEPNDELDFFTDEDLFDTIADDESPGLGILVRTDYTNEEAWQAFSAKLEEAEQEFTSIEAPEIEKMAEETPAGTSENVDVSMDTEDSTDSHPIITVIDAPLETRPLFTNIANIAALRLLNDVDLKRIQIPTNVKRFKPPNRLVDLDAWQEIYHGKTIWIYDAKSNIDQCARLVRQQSDFYGTATGDSWRARVTHICELQVNMSTGAMTIDFGGMDRYDYNERIRTLEQADT